MREWGRDSLTILVEVLGGAFRFTAGRVKPSPHGKFLQSSLKVYFCRLRVVPSFPLGDRREMRERAIFAPSSLPPLAFFCPRPTFRALSHLSRFDSRRSPRGKEGTTRSLYF